MNDMAHGWGMGFGGWLIPLLVIAFLFYLFRNKKEDRSSAQDTLDKRYANGDIDEREYMEKS
jgi:putative membrane protein